MSNVKCYSGTTVPIALAWFKNKDIAIITNSGNYCNAEWLEKGNAFEVSAKTIKWYDIFDTKQEYINNKNDITRFTQRDYDNLTQ
ncbi:MAG TPA: hypothetical protein PKD00_01575 [Burkholderiales bacterium]|nr:hypothetical protein [Burkholderiales bacterium]